MKTFIDAWLLEAPAGLSQELAGTVKLVAIEQPEERKDSLCSHIELDGRLRGSFWITVEAEALAHLLVAARVTSDESDRERDAQLWQGIIRQVADGLEEWFVEGAADGFNVMPSWLPGGFDDFVNLVIPILQRRRLFRADYEGSTLREHLGLPRPASIWAT